MVLGSGAGIVAAGVFGPAFSGRAIARAMEGQGSSGGGGGIEPSPLQREALRALRRRALRHPDSLPYPDLPPGTDTMPGVEHVVVLMMENHSFDNFLGMLGRGDGFTLDARGEPTASNPYPDGRRQHAFHMPTTCQLSKAPSQAWKASHTAFAGGNMDGFVTASMAPDDPSVGGVAMGYWTRRDLPFTYSLASRFPLADRWFSSVLGQTDPNRRYLFAGTSSGMTDDINSTNLESPGQDTLLAAPPNGTIFQRFDAHGVDWIDYAASFPLGATPELYPVDDGALLTGRRKAPTAQFFRDAVAGSLPQFSFVDPNYDTQSQENPENIVVGEAFLARVVHALAAGPSWHRTILIVTYDEHGGYYDHVAPPVALAPDDIQPFVAAGESTYDGFWRYGIRVPGVVVSPYAKRRHVSHTLYDHTSVLAFVERKWNLPAMTWRDANANDLADMLDLEAMTRRRPTFPQLPDLAAPGDTPDALACTTSGPGTIPPPSSISRARSR
jgi:phospholipase C